MATPPISRDKYMAAHRAVAQYGSVSGAAAALGVPEPTLGKQYRRALQNGETDVRHSPKAIGHPAFGKRKAKPPAEMAPAPPPAPPGFVVWRHSAQTGADGKVEREWVGSKPPPGDTFRPIEGHLIKGESALVNAEGRTLAKWIKTREAPSLHLAEALREAFAGFSGLVPPSSPPEAVAGDLLTIYPVPDLHLGMYAWGRETGEHYDVAIASATAMRCLENLIDQSLPSAQAIILVLGDYLHADSQRNATPASGHQLDVDGRRPKVYRAAVDLLMGMIERAKAKHAAVEVVIIPGNHDPDSALTMTVALSIAYSEDPRVTVPDGPHSVWYHRFGRVLFGAAHGHTMRPDRMAMMLAHDRPQEWGYTWHKHFFFGHIHHETAKEVGPVRVESFGTAAARDAYAHGAGYRASRAMTAITFHRENGEIGRHRHAVLPPRRRVRVKAIAS